jgi:hypothetical protein
VLAARTLSTEDTGDRGRPPRRARRRGLLKIYAHCIDGQADAANRRITDGRLEEVSAAPAKTKIVYRKDDRRRGSHEHTSFTFLGYT